MKGKGKERRGEYGRTEERRWRERERENEKKKVSFLYPE